MAAMVYCPDCGTANEADARFCKTCGRSLSDAKAAKAVVDPGVVAEQQPAPPAPRSEHVAAPLANDGLPAGEDLDGVPGGERVLWTGRPRIPLSWWQALTVRYKLTTERLIVTRGFISKGTEEIELYRVNDVGYHQGMRERIWGLGDVRLETSDASTPEPQLKDIRDPERVKDLIRTAARTERQRRRVLFRDEV